MSLTHSIPYDQDKIDLICHRLSEATRYEVSLEDAPSGLPTCKSGLVIKVNVAANGESSPYWTNLDDWFHADTGDLKDIDSQITSAVATVHYMLSREPLVRHA